jgi:hypothetical protein
MIDVDGGIWFQLQNPLISPGSVNPRRTLVDLILVLVRRFATIELQAKKVVRGEAVQRILKLGIHDVIGRSDAV